MVEFDATSSHMGLEKILTLMIQRKFLRVQFLNFYNELEIRMIFEDKVSVC